VERACLSEFGVPRGLKGSCHELPQMVIAEANEQSSQAAPQGAILPVPGLILSLGAEECGFYRRERHAYAVYFTHAAGGKVQFNHGL
jgi:hypothetical protein